MDIQFNKLNPIHGVISITLHESDYKSVVEKELKRYAQNVRLKGFRLGAVPPHLIKKMHGPSILVEELNKIAVGALKNYIIEERIPIFMEPLFIPPSQEIDFESQRTFTFSYEVALLEERSIALGSDISLTKFEIDGVGAKLIDEFLDALQIVHGKAIYLDQSDVDAILYGTLKDSTETVGMEVRISVMHIPENLREKLLGLRVDDKVVVTEEMLDNHFYALLGVTFPQLTAFKRHRSAWPAVFTIHKIVRVEPAPIESELFDLILGKGVATSESEFREAIAKIILFDKSTEALYAFEEDLKEQLFKRNPIDLPEAFFKKWLLVNNPEATQEEVEAYYDTHKESLKWELLLGSIVRQNNLKVTSSDVVDETKRAYIDYAHSNGLQLQDDHAAIHAGAISFLKGSEGNKYYSKIHSQLSKERAINFIKEHITVVTEIVPAEVFDARR